MEAMMKQFMASMSKEEKQKIIQEFLSSMSEGEKVEMMKLVAPIMIKDFNKNDWKKMMQEMSTEMREKFKEMMIECLKAMEET